MNIAKSIYNTHKELKSCPLRKEQFGGILYLPTKNTQIAINKAFSEFLSNLINNKKSISTENLSWKDIELITRIIKFKSQNKSIDDFLEFDKSNEKNISSLSAPIQIILEVTNKCNQYCNFCYADGDKKVGQLLSKKEIFNLIDDAANLKIFRFHLMGKEPLLRPDIIEIMSYISNKGMYVSFTTNGLLLGKFIGELKYIKNLLPIQISLHASKPETYALYNIKPKNFLKVIDNCKTLKKEKISFGIKSVISKINFRELPDIIRLSQKLGAKSITLLNLLPLGRGRDKGHLGNLNKQELKFIMNTIKNHQGDNYPKIYIDYRSFLGIYFPKKPSTPLENLVNCPAGHLDLRIRYDGKVIQCSSIRVPLFNIRSNNLKYIWENFRIKRITCPFLSKLS